MIVRIQSVTPSKTSALAEFHLTDGKVVPVFHSGAFERQILEDGIWTEDTGTLHVSDGARFMAALPKAFASSSLIHVISEPNSDDE